MDLGIEFTLVSRGKPTPIPSPEERVLSSETVIGYEEVDEWVLAEHQIIVNCTPLGMHPYENELPNIPYGYLTSNHLLYDCIYNPDRTLFLQKGKEMGCRIKNGLEMLHLQADNAWIIWK
jgi:shikimate dehydrogenase